MTKYERFEKWWWLWAVAIVTVAVAVVLTRADGITFGSVSACILGVIVTASAVVTLLWEEQNG